MTHSTTGVAQVTVNLFMVLTLAAIIGLVSFAICTVSDRRRKVRNRRIRVIRRATFGSN